MALSPEVWGPHFWFVLNTMAITYPQFPNDATTKKYYDFLHNLPLFLPDEKIGDDFSKMLDDFPPTPYLSSRLSFMKWIHFIHNRMNTKLGKNHIDFYKSLEQYYAHYKPKDLLKKEEIEQRLKYIHISVMVVLVIILFYIYNK